MNKLNMLRNKYEGKLLVFTGVDGAGKSTLLEETERILTERNIEFVVTKMPSDRIRNLEIFRNFHDSHNEKTRKAVTPFALTVLVTGDRLVVLDTDVIPALEEGKWVLCDRYVFTGLTVDNSAINIELANRFIEPNKVFLACASLKLVKERVKSRENEKDLYYDDELASQQNDRFLQMCNDNDNFVCVDTKNDKEFAFKQLHEHLNNLIDI